MVMFWMRLFGVSQIGGYLLEASSNITQAIKEELVRHVPGMKGSQYGRRRVSQGGVRLGAVSLVVITKRLKKLCL